MDGLQYSHAYTLIDLVVLSDGTKLVKMRNPYGKEQYEGEWSD